MIRTLQHDLDDLPIATRAGIEAGESKEALDELEVEQVRSGEVTSYRCPRCTLAVPADMLITFRAGRECSGCIEGRYLRGEGTRGDLWREAGQEDVPSGPYWDILRQKSRRLVRVRKRDT